MTRTHKMLIWVGLLIAVVLPLAVALNSPLLAWRGPIYIVAGAAGVIALAILLIQPLMIGGYLPGVRTPQLVHQWGGVLLIVSVAVHVAGLWVTSPPDVIDALLLRSPTQFSLWGVIAMWAVLISGVLALIRRRIGFRHWRVVHTALAVTIVSGAVIHALLIEGTMGTLTKGVLCVLVVSATAKVISDRRVWFLLKRRKPR